MTVLPGEQRSISNSRFAATRWSLVAAATVQDADAARRALIELCLRYWYPVYAYVRRCGHAPELAQEITRGFFEHLVQQRLSLPELRARGRFREYLLDALNRHLGSDWASAADPRPVAEFEQPQTWIDMEARYKTEPTHGMTPEQAYHRGYALEVLGNAMARLRREATEAGRQAMFEALVPWLGSDPGPGQYELLAAELSLRPMALIIALKRLRQRYRELAEAELGETVSSAPDLQAERELLARALDLDADPS
jgi:RNA polymerase sigma-70 factor (ECF subfamily)